VEWVFSRPGCIELTHNWGSEDLPKEPYYNNGNDDKEAQGFGHIGSVPPLQFKIPCGHSTVFV